MNAQKSATASSCSPAAPAFRISRAFSHASHHANKIILALRHAGAITYNDDNELVITNAQLLEEFAQSERKIDYKK